jgi:hypothetical protein
MSRWKRRPKREPPARFRASFRAFGGTLATVEEAKTALTAAAPGGRRPGVPLAEAVARFEWGLRKAAEGMPSWRLPEVAEAWTACAAALQESMDRTQRFRMEPSPEGYELLYLALGELMDPLGVFQDALGRFRSLGL